VIAELESEKATFEVNAEKAGVLTTVATEGDQLKIGELLATIDDRQKHRRQKLKSRLLSLLRLPLFKLLRQRKNPMLQSLLLQK